jgi:hypothetical protein
MRCARWLACLAMLVSLIGIHPSASAETAQTIVLGHSAIPLTGQWRFAIGDDLRWAAPNFDDGSWEAVDLTPAPGAHDADVGLPGYVSGWSLRGHAGYIGYAWYRMRLTVNIGTNSRLALAGPTDVDTTYQLYVDGKLLGGSGDFSGKTPTVYSVQPTMFALPVLPAGQHTYVIALRVWMDPSDAGEDSGGIHIVPQFGNVDDIAQLHQVQWLQTFKGYVVDALEPVAFVLLAIMTFALVACRRTDSYYGWLAAALLITALLRVNQVTFFWTQAESLRVYDILTAVLLVPLMLAAWTLAWRDWFSPDHYRWLARTVGVLVLLHIALALLGRPWFAAQASHGFKSVADDGVQIVRLIYAALYLWLIGVAVIRQRTIPTLLAAVAAILVGIGLFASELSAIGIPGIWFPYGTGVSRTQYAYAGFIALLFALLLMRLVRYARLRIAR